MTATAQPAWICPICGYIHYGAEPPEECPICGTPADQFEPYTEAPAAEPAPQAAAAGLDTLARQDADELFRPGALLTGSVNHRAGPLWAESARELVASWEGHEMPFDQIHGHSRLARQRLAQLLREAAAPPPPTRRATRPTRGSIRRRLDSKKRRADVKRGRGQVRGD